MNNIPNDLDALMRKSQGFWQSVVPATIWSQVAEALGRRDAGWLSGVLADGTIRVLADVQATADAVSISRSVALGVVAPMMVGRGARRGGAWDVPSYDRLERPGRLAW